MPIVVSAQTEILSPEVNKVIASSSINKPDSLAAAEEPKEEVNFAVEGANESFVLGKEVQFEGLRMAKVGSAGTILLIEDNLKPMIYLRLQRFQVDQIDVMVTTEEGQRIFASQKRNLFVGTQISINHEAWPPGDYVLHIRTSNGNKWKKEIQKTESFVIN